MAVTFPSPVSSPHCRGSVVVVVVLVVVVLVVVVVVLGMVVGVVVLVDEVDVVTLVVVGTAVVVVVGGAVSAGTFVDATLARVDVLNPESTCSMSATAG